MQTTCELVKGISRWKNSKCKLPSEFLVRSMQLVGRYDSGISYRWETTLVRAKD